MSSNYQLLVLDLDQTLIDDRDHPSVGSIPDGAASVVPCRRAGLSDHVVYDFGHLGGEEFKRAFPGSPFDLDDRAKQGCAWKFTTVHMRPSLDVFMANAFEQFKHVAIWSAASRPWVENALACEPLSQYRGRFLFVWYGDRCTMLRGLRYRDGLNPACVRTKKLAKIWRIAEHRKLGITRRNTLLVDDLPANALCNYGNLIAIPPYDSSLAAEDGVLPVLVAYLRTLQGHRGRDVRCPEKRWWYTTSLKDTTARAHAAGTACTSWALAAQAQAQREADADVDAEKSGAHTAQVTDDHSYRALGDHECFSNSSGGDVWCTHEDCLDSLFAFPSQTALDQHDALQHS